MSSVSPGGADLVPTTPDWPAWVGFMVTTHFDLVSGPFHSPNFIGLHSVSTSANMYHFNPRAGKLPRSASSHFHMSLVHSIFLALLSHNIGWKPRHQEQRTTKHVAQIGVLFKGSLSMESINSKRCISLVDIYIGQVFISDFKHTHTHTYTHTATQLLY